MMENRIFVFHISIEDTKPLIWRKLRAPGNFTLADLHKAIQIVFGWMDSHLHSFTIGGVEYMMDSEMGPDYDEDTLNEYDYRLDDLNLKKKQIFSYLYDFGDSWEHRITVSEVLPFSEDEAAPLCLEGEYACPIEDSGGVWGYAEILEILKDPGHEEYKETLEWAGDVDLLAFNVEKVNRSLKKAFKSAKTAKAARTDKSAKTAKAGTGSAGKTPKPASGKSSPKALKPAGKKAAIPGRKELPDGKLKKLYALMGRVKELKPWEKLWDTDFVLIELPGHDEPVICSVMGMEKQSFGIVIYPGFASILSLLRMLDSESDNPFTILGYQDCLLCHFGQRDELFPEERAHLKELGISFRGKHDWIYFRKAVPGHSAWYITSKDADIIIEILTCFIDAYTTFQGGLLTVDFENDQLISHRYAKKEKKWITKAGRLPPIPMVMEEFTVDSGDVEPLRFKKQIKIAMEIEILYLPQTMGLSKEGIPLLMRIALFADNKTGEILDQCFLDAGKDAGNMVIDMLYNFINDQGRPETIMVRDEFAAAVLKDFCGKTGIHLVHSKGLSAIDQFAQSLPSLLGPPAFPSGE
ncbi:MAG: plasmid pRiA4b ORF-3 family protein [Treponema sp.]|jgi:hypothetical protein|nr:plasmid pRiA4b ORF-3 family protein [Treponema sp.]